MFFNSPFRALIGTLLIASAALVTMPQRGFSTPTDGVWEGELKTIPGGSCGFRNRDVSISISKNYIYAEWLSFKNRKAIFSGIIRNNKFKLRSQRDWYLGDVGAGARSSSDVKATISGEVAGGLITGFLVTQATGSQGRNCSGNFHLTYLKALEPQMAIKLEKERVKALPKVAKIAPSPLPAPQAVATMSSRSSAGQYDGVWKGELISTSGECGFSKKKVKVTIKGGGISGVWRNIKNIPTNVVGEISGTKIKLKIQEWYALHTSGAKPARATVKGNIIENKIFGKLHAAGMWSACSAKLTLLNTGGREIALKAEVKRQKEEEAARQKEAEEIALKAEVKRQKEEEAARLKKAEEIARQAELKRQKEEEAARLKKAEEIALKAELKRQKEEEAARLKKAEEIALKAELKRQKEEEAARLKKAEELALKAELKRKKEVAQLARLKEEKRRREVESLKSSRATFAEKRVALVIGNGKYPQVGVLSNPPNDARLMTRTLRQVGFDVVETIDADQKTMKRAIASFGQKLEDAGKDAVGLFYYAGHGVQVDGINYLIPVNVNIKNESDVDIEAVSANAVQGKMAYAGNRLNIIVMDACRNNPFKRGFRSSTRGLARMSATRGTLIAYATGPGDVAADGTADNSPYTKALSKAILTPGIPVERVFKEVRNSVVAETNEGQIPWESSSLTGRDFFFKGSAADPTRFQQAGQEKLDLAFWDAIKNSKDAADYEAYLEQYPNGSFATLARVRKKRYSK